MEKDVKKNGKENGKKALRLLAVAAAVAMTGLSVLFVLVVRLAWQEMRHEGLTYSQWYEGSIYSFYNAMTAAAVAVGLCALIWYFLLRKKPVQRSDRKKRVCRVLACAFAVLTAVLIAMTRMEYTGIARAQAANAECLSANIEDYGRCMVASLLSLEACVAALLGVRG